MTKETYLKAVELMTEFEELKKAHQDAIFSFPAPTVFRRLPHDAYQRMRLMLDREYEKLIEPLQQEFDKL